MVKKLKFLWCELEAGCLSRIENEWKRTLWAEFDLVKPFLIKTDEMASYYFPEENPYCPEPMRVVIHEEGDVAAVPPSEDSAWDGIYRITKEDIRLHELNARTFFATIAEALKIRPEFRFIDENLKSWHIGACTVSPGREVSVCVAAGLSDQELAESLNAALACTPAPFVLLTPTTKSVGPETRAIAQKSNILVFMLENLVGWGENGELASPRPFEHAVAPLFLQQNGVKPIEAPLRKWPDPRTNTAANIWTRRDGTLCFSTNTNGHRDGLVEFKLKKGKPTYFIQLMKLLQFKYPEGVSLREIVEQVYPDKSASVRKGKISTGDLLKTIRSLVSGLRTKKFALAGINPDVITPLPFDAGLDAFVTLNVTMCYGEETRR